ncbi:MULTISPECIES: NAD(+)/NADH kinase [Halorubrum]|jgi:NAD+ kinase|uniref:ATP-NAD kinase n=1 Tax=Halorubrum tropicale TaxID=1765655 RepID=A0A0M9APW7_9EURY|nr:MULTISPECIES: NAD(+)/NADH kinase [Halorubrum]KOX96449.1 ATP-NAD kinase [Halorubrum tropicale]RLM52407.1 ATP-NAD kinase [Halorubrum sp. Atlit-28R]TKX44303.1 ATP-NAD kinase [Halorubrum sp. ARQ200]TKX50790.1 ATP-NAD kinase [Halorubrum sp. ASP121]TKX63638.1 ATP-NAD kinase [Halorubrum sp. ASP1]
MSEPTRGLAVLGDGDPAAAIRSAATAAGARLVDRPAADAVVAVGDAALREAMRAAASDARPAPILPVGGGRHAVDLDRATERVAAAVDGLDDASDAVEGFSRVGHPLLAVDAGDGERRVAVADVAFVTAAPARISEFEIALDDGESASVRADGAVVATPFGSDGYAAAAGGPVVSPGGGLAVVPVSPFTTRPDTWVVSGGVRVTVEREEEPVALVVDGTRRGTVEPHRAVAVEVAARVDLLAPTAE